MRVLLLCLLLLAACAPQLADDDDAANDDDASANDDDVANDDDASSDDDDDTLSGCDGVGSSDLPGVCIRFDAQDGLVGLDQVAAGIEVPYTIIVEQDIDDVVVAPRDAGGCGQPGPSGLIPFERLTGGGQDYCLCDVGLCQGPDLIPRVLSAGETARVFEWTGANWYGPSDTGNPLGDPFPPGTYTLEVSAIGWVGGLGFTVSNTFPITLSE